MTVSSSQLEAKARIEEKARQAKNTVKSYENTVDELNKVEAAVSLLSEQDELDLKTVSNAQYAVYYSEVEALGARLTTPSSFHEGFRRGIAIERLVVAENASDTKGAQAHAVFDEVLNMEGDDPEELVERIRQRLSEGFSSIYDEAWTPGTAEDSNAKDRRVQELAELNAEGASIDEPAVKKVDRAKTKVRRVIVNGEVKDIGEAW